MIEIESRDGAPIIQVDSESLRGASLRGADLRGASLRGASLRGASLRGADLYGASLYGADLCGADLREADLREADLRGADLYGARLYGADLYGAEGIIDLGCDTRGYRFVGVKHHDGWRVSAGCRWFTIDEARAHWGAKNNKDALARVAILDAHEME